ncbi:hypothetical protein SAMN05216370_4140 [Pseudomonas peli]|uniref:Uncharacterized protein n=1 Tax=Pseudomonas peli TaxID=592361 RepID=A0AB37ZCP0_9PSED|nr:hypothetical protein [Pseudomonas peli]NMZ71230.1 hypothetical protein [Pseudomonas peli]SCW86654.1 hypothetical protein SAMN05216370_4140 [Pseudomonas peli]
MLMTHKHAELLTPLMQDEDIQYWQYVEQSTIWPWFYVEQVRIHDGDRVASMLMIPSVPVLEQILTELNGSKWLTQVLVVTPSDLNGSTRWQMEPLIELSVARSPELKPLGYIFQVEDGRLYTTCPWSSCDRDRSIPIFSAAKHLRYTAHSN